MTEAKASHPPQESPLSLERLRAAFSQMLGRPAAVNARPEPTATNPSSSAESEATPSKSAFEVGPRAIVEAMLFVGRPDGQPLSSREMAATMRGVSPNEVDTTIVQLNEGYHADEAPYEIVGSPTGYQLVLRNEFRRVRDKFFGRLREAKLTAAAMEVLAIVAYEQPVTLARVNDLRGTSCNGVLAMLVRRQLVRLERTTNSCRWPEYHTTPRFLRVFRLASLNDLPRGLELAQA